MSRSADAWEECPPGEMERLSRRLRQKRRRRALLRSSGLALATLALVAAMAVWVGTAEGPPGGIPCSDVIRLANDYRHERLAPAVRAKVVSHLEHCEHCRKYYENMGLLIDRPPSSSRQLARLGALKPDANAEPGGIALAAVPMRL